MKILILFNSFVGDNGNLSGGDVRLIKFLKFLNLNKVNFDVILNNEALNLLLKNKIQLNKKIITPRIFDRFPFFISYFFRTLFILLYFLFNKNYLKSIDIFYSPSDFYPDTLPAYLFKDKKQKWIQLIHHIYPFWKDRQGNKIINFSGYYLQRFSFLLIKAKSSKVILVNDLVRQELIKYNFDEKSIFVSANGIDFDYFMDLNKNIKEYDGVFLARLKPSKGVFDLIKIWKNICDYGNYKLAIIGGGDDIITSKLKKEIEKNNLQNNIFLLGFLENDEAFSILKSSKVFLFPSHEEGWGIVIAEAMSCSIPVVSWSLPVYNEIFKDFIIKIEENNFQKFSESIVKLLKEEDLRIEIIKKANNFVKKYDWGIVLKKDFETLIT